MKVLFSVLISLLLVGGGFYAYMGGFHSVEVTQADYGPVEFIYSTHKGSYQNLAASWEKFQKEFSAAGLNQCDSLSVYLDPPGTPEDQLRSILGCRIDALTANQKQSLKNKFQSFAIPELRVLKSSFPFKNIASYFFAPTKVYPEIEKSIKENGYRSAVAIETYGTMIEPERIGFIIPIGVDKASFQQLFESF